MRVLVTGGAGYIGSVVAEELLRDGHQVVVYDNLQKGHRELVPEAAMFMHGSLQDDARLRDVLRAQQIEAVVHMAADSLVGESVANPAKYYRNNLQAGLVLLDAMREVGVGRLVFSSTVSVYGDPKRVPIEEDDPTDPVNPYGDSKLAFERALRWYDEAFGLRYVTLRYFNAAGATERCGEMHEPETHLIPLVLQAAAGLRPEIVIFGDDYPTRDGTCIRDYIHVQDLARAHVMAIGAAAKASRIYNLGCGGGGSTVKEVIAAAERVTGLRVPSRIGPRRGGDPAELVARADRIAAELGWRPEWTDIGAIVESAWRFMQAKR